MTKFVDAHMHYEVSEPIKNVVAAWQAVVPDMKQGWHTATVSFELDTKGNMTRLDEIKVCSWGRDYPHKLAP